MTAVAAASTAPISIADAHSVLLWQAAAYAEDLADATRRSRHVARAHDAMVGFLHYRLLPYLADEERELDPNQLRDEHLSRVLRSDHERLRADVDNVESSRTRRLLCLAADALIERLEHHMGREQTWVTAAARDLASEADREAEWALPLLLRDDIDLGTLPEQGRSALVLRRLQQMRPGETVRLRAGLPLHGLWRQQHRLDGTSHAWVYEQSGPSAWVARVTRRSTEG